MQTVTSFLSSLPSHWNNWFLLGLGWKPFYYVAMYLYNVVTKNPSAASTYGAQLNTWIVNTLGAIA